MKINKSIYTYVRCGDCPVFKNVLFPDFNLDDLRFQNICSKYILFHLHRLLSVFKVNHKDS